uniref:Agenet domain-containing protein n=1 Tax=Kalanchoe fedtschenkoi TaxID=63787 RepID=A0A7N0RC50_KALFE
MEYDDSNFGSQNPQINSEEIAKSSPDLGSYSLPKFDFDDSLQGDIRFDSLVETEAFLGIESQEDTSWIEDFSRGSNRINFSSQAAESASISRRNNVWSEAASLESVEMLLKAVGQEDTIPGDNEIQDCGAGDELGSSTLQLKQNEEDKDHLNANNVCPCAAIPRDEISHKFLSDDASELQHEEDVQSVPGKLCDSGNNVDFLLQEPDVEIVRCSVTIDTQALSAADNTSMDQKHELNLIKADTTSEIALLEGIQTPLSQADCHFPQTTSSFTESLSSRLQQENDTSKNLSRILQITGVRDLSEGPVMANVEEVDQTVMGKYMQQSEECSARSVAGDSEKYVTLDLYSTPEGEPGAVGTVNDHLKELFRSSTKGDHDFHLIEVCLRKSDASNPTEDCKCESDSPANVYEGSNATLEGGPVTGNPITCSCCNGKIHSDAPVIGSAVVQKKDELCGSTERDNKSVEAMARDDEICGARVELEDDLIGCAEQMDNAVALKKPENSQIENDEIMGIPSVETDNKLANDGSSLREVCSSTVLASVTPATEDLSVSITPAVSEEHIIRINISSSTTVEGATQETTADFDLGDGNDKCMDTVVNMQYSIISNVADRTCNTVRLLANDIIRDPPLESLCNTENQGTPCESPSAVPAANGRDSEEFKVSPPDVYCCSETCKDAEAEDSMHDHLGKSGTPCSYDGTSTHDGSTSQDPKVCDASDNDKTFSFVVASSAEHSETENVKLWQPFASQVPINSQIVKDSRLTPGMEQISSSNIGSHQTMGEEVIMGSRSTADRKPRRAAGKTNKKEGAKREGRQKPTAHSNLKESSIFPTVEPSFPDLNHASSSPTVHQQHFTNLQQLQLRAQIFVYGSLIQGTPPDEACMVAAFGGPDGGRSIWENARRCCLERIQGQKSQHSYLETPLQQHSSPRNTNQKGNTRKSRNKNNAPTPSKASKSTPTSTISHLAPASSPLWTIQTPANLAHFSEDAAACAVAAVDLSQEMWCQLAKQKDSGTIPDIEAKISSAALAIAAAVAVAKAAAAAGKVASDAAIQAKLMAEEAMDSSRMSFVDSSTKVLFATTVNNFENSIPSSILKGDIQMDSSSSFAARLNAQDVASKRAENMDAIVKAAELAAKAVTQAGKVAVMGDPLQLSELASAGPEGCWKLAKLSFERESQSNTVIEPHVVDTNKGGNISETVQKTLDIPMEMSGDHFEDEREPSSVVLVSKVRKAPGTAEAIPIKEGSSVEIFKEGDAIKAAWFSAYVLELKNGEAYVCYTENFPTGSSGELKEWIRLDSQNEAPKIRPAHPMSAMPTEGTRKRRREPMGKCFWSIGDRVDAWRQNCWWEGVISEKIRKDDTSFTVHFPAQRETSTIKACHLRPSLFWLDGEWVEWCNSMSYDGDMRQEKRMKFYDTEHEIKRNDKESDKLDTTESEMRADSRLVGLSNNEKAFDVGKSCRDDKRPVTHRMARSGLQNEGKKVTFGVPRSGKKRKFMDVSQHYVSRDSKMHEKNDSTRRAKMLMPQGSGLPVWKSSTRIDVREKQMPATQLRVPNSRKLTGVQDRTLEKNSISSAVSRNDNTFKSEGMTGFASFSSIGKARRAPFGFSSSSDEHSVKRRFTSTSSKSELASKSKLELPFQKLGKIEEDKVYSRTVSVSISEGAEPRRSSRRMQPTSRLLEGLQTSLTIPKLQAVSRDKGQKSHNTSASLRGKQCN